MRKLESQQKKEGEKARRKADAEFEAIRAAKYEEADADIRELKGDRRARGPTRLTGRADAECAAVAFSTGVPCLMYGEGAEKIRMERAGN